MSCIVRAMSVACVAVALASCDDRQAFRAPDPSLSRMAEQKKVDPYEPSAVFADGKSMRDPPPGTVATDDDPERPPVTRALLAGGRRSFERVCATCHGMAGDGVSVVASKMKRRPPSLHEDRLRALGDEQLFAVVRGGYGLMPPLSEMLDPAETWAVVAYVRALQLSQHARVDRLPPSLRAELAKEAP